MSNNIKAILWDNDGVLVDTEKLYFKANLEILKLYNINLSPEMYRMHFLVSNNGLPTILEKNGFKSPEIVQIRKKRNNLYSTYLREENSLIPDVFETINTLSKTHRMAIVTGSRKDHFEIIHTNTNIIHHMEFVIAQGDYSHSKPHPAPYIEAIKRLALAPEQCLAIEDTERGLISAKNAGLSVWVIPTNESKNSNFSSADKILNRISEITKFLL